MSGSNVPLIPALLTRTSSLPKVETAVATACCQAASLVTSRRTKRPTPPRLVGDLPSLGLEHVGHHHLGAFLGEDDGLALAHAAGAARDQRDLSAEPHRRLLCRVPDAGGK